MVRTVICWIIPMALFPLGCGGGESNSAPPPPPPQQQQQQRSSAHAPPATQATTGPSAGATTQASQQALEDKLYGTWVADDVDAKIGQVKIKLTFHQDGPVKIAAWSDIPFVGQVRNKSAPYEVHGNTIHSDAIRGGTSVKFWFDGDQLVIRYEQGKTIHFTRQT